MESFIYIDNISYIERGLLEDPILMQCLKTNIKNDFNYTIANVCIVSNILDNDND